MLHYFNGSLIEPIINYENISDVALIEAIFSFEVLSIVTHILWIRKKNVYFLKEIHAKEISIEEQQQTEDEEKKKKEK